MCYKVTIILTIFFYLFSPETKADEIWSEQFSVPEKGIWGIADGSGIQSDFTEITKWSLEYSDVTLSNEGDYFKTVATSGGRLEAVDINAEATWVSEEIDIEGFKNISVSFTAAETGSGNNQETKYLKAYYRIDGGEEILFAENGTNLGNFGTRQVAQNNIEGNTLQLIIKFSTHYSADKVYIDNVVVSGEKDIIIYGTKIKIRNAPNRVEKEEPFSISAEIVDDQGRVATNYSGSVYLEGETENLTGKKEVEATYGTCQWSDLSFTETGKYELILSTPTDDLAPAYHSIDVLPPSELLFSDDYESGFKDGYFPKNDWTVSEVEPINGNASLKHNLDTVTGESALFYPMQINFQEQTLEWEFKIRNENWDPSSTNKFWVYLGTDSESLDSLTGYAVGVNIIGSNDLLSLWKITEGKADSLIIETNLDWNENQITDIRVTRSAKGEWDLTYSLPTESYTSNLFKGEESSNLIGNYWGLYFKYSSSRAGKLSFDDIEIKAYDSSPFIATVKAINGTQIQVEFNEAINVSGLSKDNFSLKDSKGNTIPIEEINTPQNENKIIILSISTITDFELTLSAFNFSDLSGNITNQDSIDFLFFPPIQEYDLVINEIMADPSPVVGMPEYDFIELYNRSNYPLKLTDWSLQVADNERFLEEHILMPGEYLILCQTGAYEAFSNLGNTLSVTSFPALPVKGENIRIKVNGQIIDEINYSQDWYYNDGKDNGGWTLERIDPNRLCGQDANWTASIHPSGGTPGKANSVLSENPDFIAPYALWAASISPTQVELQFSEPMEIGTLMNKLNYTVSDGIGNPKNIEPISKSAIILNYTSELTEDKIYQLNIHELIDECGNPLSDISMEIQWVNIYPGDIVINEVLYDPFPNGEDFVELYNNSDKKIALSRIQLASKDDDNDSKQIYSISNNKFLFEPHTYLLCTKSPSLILESYYSECPSCFIEMPKFPSYVNEEGIVVLLKDSTEIVDEFAYSDKLHSPLLYDPEGISLERVGFDLETNQASTWSSASEIVGYATPGYKNSQTKDNLIHKEVTFEPKSISPNNDGYNDALHINYQLDEPNYVANIWIFDSAGRTMAQIAQNTLLGTSGTIFWNGEDETGSKLPLGPYIIVVELFDHKGSVKRYKEACIITDLLN